MIALLDADILCYRVGFATEDEHENTAIETMAVFLEDLLMFDLVDTEEHELFLTGKANFRNDIAVTAPYKGNRKDVKKPVHLPLLREYLQTAWGASVSDGQEADDDIAIRATELGDESIIVSIDKDFINKCKNLKFIARIGSGIENIDVDYAKQKGIQIISTPEGNSSFINASIVFDDEL